MSDETARKVLLHWGLTDNEATEFIGGVKRGAKVRNEGRMLPWSQVKKELGLDEEVGDNHSTIEA